MEVKRIIVRYAVDHIDVETIHENGSSFVVSYETIHEAAEHCGIEPSVKLLEALEANNGEYEVELH